MNKLFLSVLFLFSLNGLASVEFESFLKSAEGNYYGEIRGLYKAKWSAVFHGESSPWKMLEGTLEIEEGGKVLKHSFTVQKNFHAMIDEPVYVIKLANAEFKMESVLSNPKAKGLFSLWNYYEEAEYFSAEGISMGFEDGELTFGFIGGDLYCPQKDGTTKICGSGSYLPYHMTKK